MFFDFSIPFALDVCFALVFVGLAVVGYHFIRLIRKYIEDGEARHAQRFVRATKISNAGRRAELSPSLALQVRAAFASCDSRVVSKNPTSVTGPELMIRRTA